MVEAELYNGKHVVSFQEKTHRYQIDGLPVKGVTTILASVLAKNGLMLWPLNKAIDFLKDKIDNAESITDSVASAMITLKDLEEAKQQHILLRLEGANAGTATHKLVEAILRDEQVELLEQPVEVIKAVEAFERWLSKTMPDVLAVEKIVYSKELDYVGTLDSILKIDDKVYLCDLKTTNASKDAKKGVYPENFVQLGGYARAYLEQRNFEIEDKGDSDLVELNDLMVISARKDGKLDTVKASELGLSVEDCIHLWECVHTLYSTLDELKGKLGVR